MTKKISLFIIFVLFSANSWAAKAPNGKEFPAHWGEPPAIQTRDLRPLPGGYGQGSSTLANWIKANMKKDEEKGKTQALGFEARLHLAIKTCIHVLVLCNLDWKR